VRVLDQVTVERARADSNPDIPIASRHRSVGGIVSSNYVAVNAAQHNIAER
jgi:hypothetical protein